MPEKPNIGFWKLVRQSELHLVTQDVYCIDQHRVSAPHLQYVGGIGAMEGKPLPTPLQSFMDAADDGVILVAMGSSMDVIPHATLNKMLRVFARLKQRVIIRHSGDTHTMPTKNVLMQDWLPQNDILAHNNTRIFVTHCGNNGQLEAVYHGVPMLMLPLRHEQKYNARRAERRNYGLTLDPWSFSEDEFARAIHRLLTDPTFRTSIARCSAIQRSMPLPKDRAAFWIEHVLRFGGDHLRPYYIDMPLWQFFLLDVLVFLVLTSLVTVTCMCWNAKRIFRALCVRKRERQHQD